MSSTGWVRTLTSGGKIRSLGQPKKGCQTATGYYRVRSGKKAFLVHQIVALVFLGEAPSARHTVDHIDGDKGNNAASNLRWATRSTQRLNQGHRRLARTAKRVEVVDTNGRSAFFSGLKDAAQAIGCDKSSVSKAIRLKTTILGHRVSHAPSEDQEAIQDETGTEVWKEAIIEPLRLRVSSFGRVQRKNDRGEGWGYRFTPVVAQGQSYAMLRTSTKNFTLHWTIMQTFRPNNQAGRVVDHIDRDRNNNRLDNLRWATVSENSKNRSHCHQKTRK